MGERYGIVEADSLNFVGPGGDGPASGLTVHQQISLGLGESFQKERHVQMLFCQRQHVAVIKYHAGAGCTMALLAYSCHSIFMDGRKGLHMVNSCVKMLTRLECCAART